jgi:hypothetical protein
MLFAQWEPEVRLTYNDSLSHTSRVGRNIATAPGGVVHVVWTDERNGAANEEIYYKRSTDGGINWSEDIRLTDTQGWSVSPSISVSGSMVHIVWDCFRWAYYKRSTDGGDTWSSDICLSDTNKGIAHNISVVDSVVHVVWEDYRDGRHTYYRRSTNHGVSWDPEIIIASGSMEMCGPYDPNISASGTNVHVACYYWDTLAHHYEAHYLHSTNSGTSWEPEMLLCVHGNRPIIDANSDSMVYVVLQYGENIHYLRSTNNGVGWSRDSLTWTYFVSYARVCASGTNVHVVWFDTRYGSYEILYKRSIDEGTTWGPDTRLSNGPGWSVYPSVAASDSIVHVVWWDERDPVWPNSEIYYRRNPTGNTGVEEKTDTRCQISDYRLKIRPNPFVFYTTVHGYEEKDFTLYDISGRVLGAYKGDRIGVDLSPGVYFLVPENNNAKVSYSKK